MAGLFITGTDTEVGKTAISLGLMAQFKGRGIAVAGVKPVAAGCHTTPAGPRNDDALALQAAASQALPYEQVNPYALAEPVAPHLAAARAGQSIALRPLVAAVQALERQGLTVVVEGAGGFLVPINEQESLADLAVALGLPVVLVVGLRLGCINHALLSAASIRAMGLSLAGWVANSVGPSMALEAENIATLRARLPAPLLGVVPHFPSPPSAEQVGEHLHLPPLAWGR